MTTLPSRFGIEPRQTVEREVLQVDDIKAVLANASDLVTSVVSHIYCADRMSAFQIAEYDAYVLDALQECVLGLEVPRL